MTGSTDFSTAFAKDLSVGQESEENVLKRIRDKYPTAVLVPGKFKPYDIFIPERSKSRSKSRPKKSRNKKYSYWIKNV